jgi:hypothetical protein
MQLQELTVMQMVYLLQLTITNTLVSKKTLQCAAFFWFVF